MITKQNAAQWLPLVQAMAEGKEVERRGEVSKWTNAEALSSQNCPQFYRIKPEARWRAWKPEEVPAYIIICGKIDQRPDVLVNGEWLGGGAVPLDTLFTNYVRISEDGSKSPCGVLCEGEERGEG